MRNTKDRNHAVRTVKKYSGVISRHTRTFLLTTHVPPWNFTQLNLTVAELVMLKQMKEKYPAR